MATYVDLDTLHTPSAGTRPPSSWGAQVNENFDYIYDEVLSKLGGWTSYTPTLTQSATVSKTVNYAKYRKVGKTVIGNVSLACTSAGTAGNAILIGMPVVAAYATNQVVGSGYVLDASVGFYAGILLASTTSVFSLLNPAAGAANVLGISGMSAALASGDSISVAFHYEAA